MLRIEIRSANDQPPLDSRVAEFDELGGTIGRSEGNTLVLPDEKRYISRTQASIAFRAGSYVLRDHGSATPTIVNGNAVGVGNEVVLHADDEIRIGGYVLAVATRQLTATGAADPFADLLPPSAPAAAPPLAVPSPQPVHDPFADPFAAPAARASQPSAPGGVIPQDFDPFADLLPSSAPGAGSPSLADSVVPSASGASVDDLFGLKGSGSSWDPLAPSDPLSGLGDSAPGASSSDPFAAFGSEGVRAPAQTPAQRDDAPILSGAFRPPQARIDPRFATPAPAEEASQNDPVLSWDQSPTTGEIHSVVLPSPRRPASAPAASQPGLGAQPEAEPGPRPVVSAPASGASAGTPPASDVANDALLRAFLSGAGLPDAKIASGLTPEFMALLGELMREATRGTLELLLARALTKREVRAETTVIVARENNPLKFSPTVEAALMHLLTPPASGFMPPAEAIRDAFNDLRSHQFGVMAGMRGALHGVLGRFDPTQLEQRLTQKGLLGALVPATRRAKLWELYEQLFRDISAEAEDDFHTLFGKEFLRAYEAQIDKLEQEDAAAKR